jgi:hypothetical protein
MLRGLWRLCRVRTMTPRAQTVLVHTPSPKSSEALCSMHYTPSAPAASCTLRLFAIFCKRGSTERSGYLFDKLKHVMPHTICQVSRVSLFYPNIARASEGYSCNFLRKKEVGSFHHHTSDKSYISLLQRMHTQYEHMSYHRIHVL